MPIRSFTIGYMLVGALLLFAFQRPAPRPQHRYSQVVDLTDTVLVKTGSEARSGTRIISPAALVPGTWGAAQIPAERLIAPLVVMALKAPRRHRFLSMTLSAGKHSTGMCRWARLLQCDERYPPKNRALRREIQEEIVPGTRLEQPAVSGPLRHIVLSEVPRNQGCGCSDSHLAYLGFDSKPDPPVNSRN
jgi:hypothetical protein